MDQPVLLFRTSFWAVWRWSATFFGACVLAVWLAFIIASGLLADLEFHLQLALAIGLMSGLVVSLMAVLSVRYFPVYVEADGITSYDPRGLSHFAAWEAIEQVWPFSFLGLRYLWVRSSDRRNRCWCPCTCRTCPASAPPS